MRRSTRLLVFCSVLLLPWFMAIHSAAAGGRSGFRRGHKPPPKTVYNAIASVDATAMTITTEAKNIPSTATKTYRISPQVRITVNGRDATIADLKPGLQISVGAGMDADVAEELSARNPLPDPARAGKGSHHKRR